MPNRIPDFIQKSIIYLYPKSDKPDGERAWKGGGSGFIIGVPSEVDDHFIYLYAVTNWHVIQGKDGVASPSPVIRLNLKSGKFCAIDKDVSDWKKHPNDEDLAMCYIEMDVDQDKHDIDFAIPTDWFADKKVEAKVSNDKSIKIELGSGDETFVVGRFQSVEGKQQNTPSTRWGAFSQMDIEPLLNPLGKKRYAYLIETHSISGFSGSPVFAYIDLSRPRPELDTMYLSKTYMWLIGVDMGHWPIHEKVEYRDDGEWRRETGTRVLANSAMMSVVPIARLWDLIDLPEFVMTRKNHDKRLKAKLEKEIDEGESVIGDSIPDITEEDF